MQLSNRGEQLNAESFRLAPPLSVQGTCGVLVLDSNGVVVGMSEALESILGLRCGVALESQTNGLERLREIASAAKAAPTGAVERLVALPRGTGKEVAAFRVYGFSCNRGTLGETVILVVKSDVAGSSFQSTLLQIDRLTSLGTLSASMAHEVKNALVAVKTFIDLLLEKDPDAEMGALVKRELARIESLVTGTLKFAGSARPEQPTVRLHASLEQALNLVGPQLRAKGVTVQRAFSATFDSAQGDEPQLEQAFVNLFINGLEAMSTGGTLFVGTEDLPMDPHQTAGRRVRLTIRDSGPGIPSENLRRLFEPFFTTKPNGTGLGLTITRRIVEDSGGSMSVESKPGEGTTFYLVLPVGEGQEGPA